MFLYILMLSFSRILSYLVCTYMHTCIHTMVDLSPLEKLKTTVNKGHFTARGRTNVSKTNILFVGSFSMYILVLVDPVVPRE